MPARLVVLASGAGTTLQAVLDMSADPGYGARVVAVGADRHGTRALDRAGAAGVPAFVVGLADCADRDEFDARTLDAVAACEPDLVVCAGYLRVLGAAFVRRFRVVNTHPSLLPAFPGVHAVADALRYGVRVTGVTVHAVDEGLDTGPILAQRCVEVLDDDDEASLRARVQAVERPLYADVVGRLAREGWPSWLAEGRRSPGPGR